MLIFLILNLVFKQSLHIFVELVIPTKMVIYNPKTKKKILLFFLFVISSLSLFSQVWNKPVLGFSNACATNGVFNEFTVEASYSSQPFTDSNNVFILELSDPDGSFDDPSKIINLKTISGENSFRFDIDFQLIDGVYGENYKVRVRSTHPELISPESDSFSAYFLPAFAPTLNNFEDVVLCSSSDSKEITLSFGDGTDASKYRYQWYLDGQPLTEGGETLTVDRAGSYSATLLVQGGCRADSSNLIRVSVLNDIELILNAGINSVQLCSDESTTLKANVEDNSYKYKWYKDGEQITGLPDFTPEYTTPVNNQFGTYFLEIESSGCVIKSQEIVVEQKSTADFNVSAVSATTAVILPLDQVMLEINIEPTLSDFDIRWYRDGEVIQGTASGNKLNVFSPGVYFAEVIDNSGICKVSKNSPEFNVLEVAKIVSTIRTSTDYVECESDETKLSIVGVKAKATDGNEYDLSQDQLDLLNHQWFKDGAAIPGATNDELEVSSYEQNGEYSLVSSINSLSSESEKLKVSLIVNAEITSSSPSNTLCPGGVITFSIDQVSGYTYTWFKDGEVMSITDPSNVEINEVGEYSLTYEGFGCSKDLEPIAVVEFDETVIEVTPSTTAILIPGETAVITASGADSFEWFDSNDRLLSTNETLEVNTLGTYRLVAKVGLCSAEKEINVVEDDGNFVIPNILTPFNRDGVNDTWVLPNKFAFQPEVQVLIYNSRGKEVLNTKDYQNNWPESNNLKDGMLFYFKVIKEDTLIKAGTISVLK